MAADIFQRLLFATVEHIFALIIIAALLWQLYCCFYHIRLRRRNRSRFTSDYIPSPPPPPLTRPLDPSLFEFLPTFTHSSSAADACAICLNEFQGGDSGRVLPNCDHFFHLNCVDKWLREESSTCPVCRKVVDPPRRIMSRHENTETSAGEEGQLENSLNISLPPPIRCPENTLQGTELEGVAIEIPEAESTLSHGS